MVGQSGSEGVPPSANALPCPCAQRDALRVTVLAKHGDDVSLRVEEVLLGALPLVPGDTIEGSTYDDTFACGLGCADIEVGEQAFAFYWGPLAPALPPCAEREACIAACEAEFATAPGGFDPSASVASDSGAPTCGPRVGPTCHCERETAAVCPPRPEPDPRRASVTLSPWTDPIVFARSELGELSVPLGELGELFRLSGDDQVTSCMERFGQWSDYWPGPGTI